MTKQEAEMKTVCALKCLLYVAGFLFKKNKNSKAPEEAEVRSCL